LLLLLSVYKSDSNFLGENRRIVTLHPAFNNLFTQAASSKDNFVHEKTLVIICTYASDPTSYPVYHALLVKAKAFQSVIRCLSSNDEVLISLSLKGTLLLAQQAQGKPALREAGAVEVLRALSTRVIPSEKCSTFQMAAKKAMTMIGE
jgi:hypothetical protein